MATPKSVGRLSLSPPRLSHVDEKGRVKMVDVGEKAVTAREALAALIKKSAPKPVVSSGIDAIVRGSDQFEMEEIGLDLRPAEAPIEPSEFLFQAPAALPPPPPSTAAAVKAAPPPPPEEDEQVEMDDLVMPPPKTLLEIASAPPPPAAVAPAASAPAAR